MATHTGSKILIVDDEKDICTLLSEFMKNENLEPVVAYTGEAALEKIRTEQPDALFVDIKLPDTDGMQILKSAKDLDQDLPVILMTGYPEVRQAVAAMRGGAHDYLVKPLKHHEVVRAVLRALNERALKRKVQRLSSQIEDAASLRESMGPSSAVGRLIADVSRVAKSDFSTLILGETGTGKELVAHAIHQLSPRCKAPFMAVDCGAIPETLLESELFGHEKGAYTGADKQRVGKFELACGGTLFLDEISNMPQGSQAKLLRALQEKAIYRIGGTQAINMDVRVLAASNQNLELVSEGESLRRDVYFRLNEFTMLVPPLRERKEDILYLAKRFMDIANHELQKKVRHFSQSAADALLSFDWPGNVRQLRSVIRRATLLADDIITEDHLGVVWIPHGLKAPDLGCISTMQDPSLRGLSLREIVHRKKVAVEREILAQALRETGGNKAKAARLLHIDYKTIHSKISQYGLSTD